MSTIQRSVKNGNFTWENTLGTFWRNHLVNYKDWEGTIEIIIIIIIIIITIMSLL